jgi:catechol 2,3-dioxygenase-like lactoylglutathione lyase family enzyme
MQVQFITSVSVITPDPPASRALYIEALGLPLEQLDGEYYASENIDGCKHFGVWPLSQAAQACFGSDSWPAGLSIPQVSIEFEVADAASVAAAARELEQRGHAMLHPAHTEPWGQTVARLQSPEGAIVGISYAPSLHETRADTASSPGPRGPAS